MEFRQLRYFLTLAEELNFNRAAVRLHISQPPLTRQIQQLERDFGTPLFSRTPRGVELTEAGRVFREDAQRLVTLAEQTRERARLAGEGHLGRLDVGIFGSAVLNVIPRMILSFRRLFPEVHVVLHNMNKVEQVAALREGRITIGFNRILPVMTDITVEMVLQEKLVVAINRSHRLSAAREIAIADLEGEPMIIFPSTPRPGMADQIYALCHDNGFAPNTVQEVGDPVTAAALVSSGFGLCLFPESATSLQLPQVVFRRLEWPHPTVNLDCLYRSNDQSRILAEFLQIVRGFRPSGSQAGLDQ